uniref:Uncharacterized protein n=1 Tax=Arundo donax TaxID=35708 RepID=A0A0A8Y076_ARUDO
MYRLNEIRISCRYRHNQIRLSCR